MADVHSIKAETTTRPPIAQNLFIGDSDQSTAQNVANVLKYIAVMAPNEEYSLNEGEEMGRFLILQSCAEALETISGTAD